MHNQRIRILFAASLVVLDAFVITFSFWAAYRLRMIIPWPAELAETVAAQGGFEGEDFRVSAGRLRLLRLDTEPWQELDPSTLLTPAFQASPEMRHAVIVERLCRPNLCPEGGEVTWKFPHSLEELQRDTDGDGYRLGLVMQATPLDSVRQVSEAGELMPQKSTFFYPKLATGLAINPLE